MLRRASLLSVVLLALAGPSLAAGPVPRPERPLTCVAPVVPSRAACTFDVWGIVSDVHGFPVRGATVSDGMATTTTDGHGFYDLRLATPGSRTIEVRTVGECGTRFSVTVDAAAAIAQGGHRRDVRLPCAPPTYNAFGFGVVQDGSLVAVARAGLRHSGQVGGLEQYGASGPALERPMVLTQSAFDDRDAAGGLTRSGALMVFYARFDVTANRWTDIAYLRLARTGSTSGVISAGANEAFSPYGPLVILPSGRLMQTFYGWDGRHWRIYTAFSSDDGRTWSTLTPIDNRPPFSANEAAAVYLDGATDGTARLLLVARAYGGRRPNRWWGLVQYESRDGGRSWERRGVIRTTVTKRECMPWLFALPGGRVAMVWADRGTMSLKRSITPFADALAMRWHTPALMYRSAVPGSPDPDIGDFGYPSIVSYGPRDDQKAVVFNDADPAGSSRWLTDVDLYVLPLWASPSVKPRPISP